MKAEEKKWQGFKASKPDNICKEELYMIHYINRVATCQIENGQMQTNHPTSKPHPYQ